jgi:APA family basic amino acid/polyamine antiporter
MSTATNGKPTLQRQLGIWSAVALVISNMIGTGIFTTTGFLAGDLGHPLLVIGIWILGALFATAGAMCYSELGINFPKSGGEYVYLRNAYGPVWGFLSGWVSFFAGFSAPIAAAALAFAGYLAYVLPGLAAEGRTTTIEWAAISWQVGPTQFVAAGLILGFTLLNCVAVSVVARVQNVLTTAKVVVIVAFVLLGMFAGNGDWENFERTTARTSATPLLQQLAISLFWVMFGYSGWNAATYVAEELRDPERVLPRALIVGTTAVALLYMLLNVAFIYATPLEQMKGVVAVGALAASALFGPGAAVVFSGLMALAIVSTVNAMITIGPRVYYAMAQDGAFLSVAARLSARSRVPVAAVLSQGACAMLMAFSSFPQLVTYIGFSLTFFTALAVMSLLVFRRRSGWKRIPAVSFAYPLVPVTYLAVAAWMVYYGFMLRPAISVAAVLTLVVGVGVYYLRVRNSPTLAGR